ncbi:MAG: DUF177 domain-containing protein [Pseudomonadota bacterium]
MLISVSHLKQGQVIELKGNLKSQHWLVESFSAIEPKVKEFEFDLTLEKKGDFVEADGNFFGRAALTCVRCLEQFEVPFNDSFRVFLYSEDGTYVGDGGEHAVKEGNMEFAFFQGDKINVGELLREQLLLNLPDYPVCEETCGGCAGCGKTENPVNTKRCACNDAGNKNPFYNLKKLKLKK